MTTQLPDLLNPRHRSLTRGNILVWGSVVLAVAISHIFPNTRATLFQLIPSLLSIAGTADTLRCIRKRWSFYHAGVLFCLYMDLMAVCVILFLLVYPFTYALSI